LDALVFLELFATEFNCFFTFGTLFLSFVNLVEHACVVSENLNVLLTFASEYSPSVLNQCLDVGDCVIELVLARAAVIA